jgi:hypothetical protein
LGIGYRCFVRKEKKFGHTTKKDVVKHPGKNFPWLKKFNFSLKISISLGLWLNDK